MDETPTRGESLEKLLNQYRRMMMGAMPFIPEPSAQMVKLIWLRLEGQCDSLGLEIIGERPRLQDPA